MTWIKKHLLIIGIVLVMSALLFTAGIFTGYSYCKRSQDQGVIKQQQKDAVMVEKHETRKDEVGDEVNEIIRTTVQTVVDPSGCLDAPNPDKYLDGLLRADRAAQSGFD